MIKYLNDSNPGALEKVYDAYLLYIKKSEASTIVANQNSWITSLITKGVTSMKPNLHDKAL
jgi:hypothetical protein